MHSASSSLAAMLGIRIPVIQAPMAGVSTTRLAAAVSEAGALGSIAVGAGTPEQAAAAIAEMQRLTSRPFNVNLFCHRPARADAAREARWLEHLAPHFRAAGGSPPDSLREIYKSFVEDEAMLDVLLKSRPPVVSFHFGLPPARFVEALKQAGIRLLASATTPDEAVRVEQAGVDAIVAQGVEAGGHRGVFDPDAGDDEIGTLALVRLLANATRLPVVAAGGIMDGQGIRAALALGAAGAQLGTAFILCPESAATQHHRTLMKSPRAAHTAITSALSGRPARGIVNRFFSEVGAAGHPPLPDYPIAYDAAKALHAAAGSNGVQEYAACWAGQGAPLARELPAAQLVAMLEQEMGA